VLTAPDLLSAEAVADPYAAFGALREHEPVHYHAGHRSWLITRYEDVAAGFRDRRLSSDRVASVYASKLDDAQREARAATFAVLSDWMVFKDPPDHTRLRNLVKLAFTPRAVQALQPRVVEIVEEVLDVPAAGTIDVVRDIAFPIPAMVIAEMLGVPAEDRDLFRAWSNAASTVIFEAVRDDEDRRRAQDGLVALSDYLQDLVRRYRAHPGDNIISALIRAREHDDALSEGEVVNTCLLLLFGGHETTTNLIANGFLALIGHPDQRALLRADPSLVPAAVEELNRFDGPAKMVVRRAACDVELHGRLIPAGDRVLLVQCAANRDPRRFTEPDRVDIRREDNRNLAFGFGIHYCLGAPLARLEVATALPRMLERLADPVVDADRLTWLPLLLTRGLSSLPVRYGRDRTG
jgi:cytochrome P450